MIAPMKRALNGLLRDADVMTLAFAIALGWALYQVAHGFSQLLSALTSPSARGMADDYGVAYVGPLMWTIGDRVLYLGPLVFGLVEFVLIALVAALLHARFLDDEPPTTTA
jgi:large-conductance mechanosensitive channel